MSPSQNNSPGADLARLPNGGPRERLVPSRYVTVELAALLTGYTDGAIRHKIERGIWLEGRQWVKRDGRVLIDLTGVERWHLTGNP